MQLNRTYILQRLKEQNIEDLKKLDLNKLLDIIEVCLNDFKDELLR